MWSRSFALVAAVALGGVAAAEPPARPAALRVLSYNIHHAEGTDGKLDLDRIARVITDAKPDLVAVQEVDRKTRRAGGVDQAAELGKRTGLHVEFGKAIDYQGGEYGLAVLSRVPIKAAKVHPLPGKPGQEARIVLEARVEPPGAPSVTFLNTHFQHDDPAVRTEQAARVNELFGKAAGPHVLAGDLNAVPDSAPMRVIGQAWTFATPPADRLRTIPVADPMRQIDYILFRPAGRFRPAEARVIEEKMASDHRPVLAMLEWAGK